ncbi:MAG: GNAT family N-acetyltransferase [Planctomycetaceae bacterium]
MSQLESRRLDLNRDIPDVVRLFERLFQKDASRNLWEWKYLPPWSERPCAWVGLADGQIIGHMAAVPLRGQINGQEAPFFLFGDTMIDPAYRTLSTYRQLSVMNGAEEIRREHPSGVLYGFGGKEVLLWTNWLGAGDAS